MLVKPLFVYMYEMLITHVFNNNNKPKQKKHRARFPPVVVVFVCFVLFVLFVCVVCLMSIYAVLFVFLFCLYTCIWIWLTYHRETLVLVWLCAANFGFSKVPAGWWILNIVFFHYFSKVVNCKHCCSNVLKKWIIVNIWVFMCFSKVVNRQHAFVLEFWQSGQS